MATEATIFDYLEQLKKFYDNKNSFTKGILVDNIDNIDKPIIKLINLNNPRRISLSKYCIKFASNYNSNIIFKDWEKLICSN